MRFSRRALVVIGIVIAAGAVAWHYLMRFPPDDTVEGAYVRIAHAVGRDAPIDCFAYLEEDAQHAAFSIVDYARKADARIRASYPPEAQARELPRYAELAQLDGGAELWAHFSRDRGYLTRLRRDLSGIDEVVRAGERATVVTARGTRYSFRKRPNGIWGLTLFTAELEAEATRMARDWELIQQAARDYDAVRD